MVALRQKMETTMPSVWEGVAAAPSVWNALAELQRLSDRVDESTDEELDAAVVERFGGTQAQLAESIDYRKELKAQISGQIALAKKRIEDIKTCIKRLEKLEASLDRATLRAVQAFPDMPLRDSNGVKVYAGTSTALEIHLETLKRSFGNILCDQDVRLVLDTAGEQYLQRVEFITLNAAKLKEDLAAGTADVAWAEIRKNTHLRGL